MKKKYWHPYSYYHKKNTIKMPNNNEEIQVILRDGSIMNGIMRGFDWYWDDDVDTDIVKWRRLTKTELLVKDLNNL